MKKYGKLHSAESAGRALNKPNTIKQKKKSVYKKDTHINAKIDRGANGRQVLRRFAGENAISERGLVGGGGVNLNKGTGASSVTEKKRRDGWGEAKKKSSSETVAGK